MRLLDVVRGLFSTLLQVVLRTTVLRRGDATTLVYTEYRRTRGRQPIYAVSWTSMTVSCVVPRIMVVLRIGLGLLLSLP